MHRFFCPSVNFSAGTIVIDDKRQVHHARDVLRLKPKEKVVIFDELGNEYGCVTEQVSEEITLSVKDMRLASQKDKIVRISVACAIAKKSKMDEVIDTLTQLGVERIIPLETQRVIVRLDKTKKASRLARWRKIAMSAARQSHRSTLVAIEPIKNIKEILGEIREYDLRLIPTLIGERKPLKEILADSRPGNILILIGPEGDFTPDEVSLAVKSGCIPVSLGDLVLRVETAAVAAVSYIRLSL